MWGFSDFSIPVVNRNNFPIAYTVAHRRPSLERQSTLYDEHMHYGVDGYGSDSRVGRMSATYPECHTDIRQSDYYDTITGYVYQDER